MTEAFIGNVSLQDFLMFLFVVIFTFILGSSLNVLIIRLLKEKTRPVVYKTASKIAMYGVYAFGLYFAFTGIINLSIPAGLAALGILGVALLLPMVPVLQNIVAGIVIAFERPFKEEDVLDISGDLCKVKDIMLRKTTLRSFEGKIVTVPNLSFITGNVVNYSRGEFIKISLHIDISLDSDKEKAKQIIEKICSDSPNILPNVPEKKLDTITRIFEVPKNFFKIPRNVKNLAPKVMVKGVSKDKISLRVWFWIWDISLKEKIISSFYEKLMEEFRKDNVKFG